MWGCPGPTKGVPTPAPPGTGPPIFWTTSLSGSPSVKAIAKVNHLLFYLLMVSVGLQESSGYV